MGGRSPHSCPSGDPAFCQATVDLIARDANEGDTRLLVTDFLCDGLGYNKYEDLATEYQVEEFPG